MSIDTFEPPRVEALQPSIRRAPARLSTPRVSRWLGGGVAGNRRLTEMVGVTLIVLLALMGVTILRIHALLSVHEFVGVLLAGPMSLKLASVGYRFTRYYTGDADYRQAGPPRLGLRLLAPVLVASTLSIFATGLVLLIEGQHRSSQVILLHKASFFLWIAVAAIHVLGHLPAIGRSLQAAVVRRTGSPGAHGRWLVLAGALCAGLVLALALHSQMVGF